MTGKRLNAVAAAAAVALSIGSSARAQNGLLPTINAGLGGPGGARNLARINAASGAGFYSRTATSRGPSAVPIFVTSPGAGIVPTDPLVRQIQIGPAPVGLLTGLDPTSGLGVAGVPGSGGRIVRTVGPVVQTPAGPAMRAVDASTGIEFLALVPRETSAAPVVTNPGELVTAKVVRVTRDSVFLEREADGRTLTEIVPPNQVYTPVQGGFVPANTVRRLRPGAEVFIPFSGAGRGTISITRPTSFGTRASSSSRSGSGR